MNCADDTVARYGAGEIGKREPGKGTKEAVVAVTGIDEDEGKGVGVDGSRT